MLNTLYMREQELKAEWRKQERDRFVKALKKIGIISDAQEKEALDHSEREAANDCYTYNRKKFC